MATYSDLYNQIVGSWGGGVSDDWNGVWSPEEQPTRRTATAPTIPTAPVEPDVIAGGDAAKNLVKSTANLYGGIFPDDAIRSSPFGNYMEYLNAMQEYDKKYKQYKTDLANYNTLQSRYDTEYQNAMDRYNQNMQNYPGYNQAFNALDWDNMPWQEYVDLGLSTDEVRRLYASGIMKGMSAADIDTAIRANSTMFAPNLGSELDIPTPTGNTDYSESNSSTYSGLSDEQMAQLNTVLETMLPWAGDYNTVLKNLSSPATFIESYKPVQDSLIKTELNKLVNKGLMSSSDADLMYKEVLNQAPAAYLQNLGTVADAYGAGMDKLMSALDAGRVTSGSSSSYSETPSTNWQIMIDALG